MDDVLNKCDVFSARGISFQDMEVRGKTGEGEQKAKQYLRCEIEKRHLESTVGERWCWVSKATAV